MGNITEVTRVEIDEVIMPALIQTWQAIGPDAEQYCSSNEEAVEMCIDADRIETFGGEDAERAGALVTKYISNVGYEEALTELGKRLNVI